MSQYTSAPAAPNNQMALTSLISGIVAWALWVLFLCLALVTFGLLGPCGFLSVIPWGIAVVTGHMGISQIARTNESGRGLAIAGLVMGYLGLTLTLCTLAFYVLSWMGIAVFSFLATPPPYSP